MKDIKPEDSEKFWKWITSQDPNLGKLLRLYAVSPGDVIALKPIWMREERYNTYQELLKEWLTNNGFIEPL